MTGKFIQRNIAGSLVEHLAFNLVYIHLPSGNGEGDFLIVTQEGYVNVCLRFSPHDIDRVLEVCRVHIKILAYPVQDISPADAGFLGRSAFKHADDGTFLRFHIGLDHYADTDIFSLILFPEFFVFLRIVIEGIWIIQPCHQAPGGIFDHLFLIRFHIEAFICGIKNIKHF